MANEAIGQLTSMQEPLATLAKRRSEETAAQKKLQEAGQAKTEFEGLQQKMEAERAFQKAQAESAAESQYAQRFAEAPQREQMKQVTQDMGKPFVPTRDNTRDLASLFMLVNLAGFAIGKGGKANAQAAMSAMNGMVEGYRQGRNDL